MKKRAIWLFAAMALATGLSAQDRPQEKKDRPQMTQEERIQARVESLNKELSLTDTQKQELTKIFTDQAEKMKTMRSTAKRDTTANNEEARKAAGEQFKKMQEETNAAIKKTLGDEKYEKYQELQKKQMQQRGMRSGRQERPNGQRPEGFRPEGRPEGFGPEGQGGPGGFRPDGPMNNGGDME